MEKKFLSVKLGFVDDIDCIMKYLYLIRHAKSSWKDNSLADHDRPLNKRGRRDAPMMGKRLRHQAIMPDLMLSSTALRAVKTAHAIAKEIGYPKKEINYQKALYHASPEEMLSQIRQIHNSNQALFLVGHNPGMTDLADELTHSDIDNIVTCGIYALALDIDSWSQIRADGKASLQFYDYPKKGS